MGGGRGAAVSIPCPFCRAEATELVSLFGSQLLLSQYRCTRCGSYFEGLRQDRWDAERVASVDEGDQHGS
jgi:transposase-like protein